MSDLIPFFFKFSDGYTGKRCSDDIDECENYPCLNQGSCINTYGSFYCICPESYQGSLCEIEPCDLDNPCLNNSTCVSQPGGATCHCTSLYTGEDCGKGTKFFIFQTFDESWSDTFSQTRSTGFY